MKKEITLIVRITKVMANYIDSKRNTRETRSEVVREIIEAAKRKDEEQK